MKPIELPYQEPKPTPAPPVVHLEQIVGFFPQVSAAPTWTPRTFRDQFAVYANSGTSPAFRFYVYDTTNNAWRYASLS